MNIISVRKERKIGKTITESDHLICYNFLKLQLGY